ncbi:MAG: helix-turn-helix transcriptional regulator [Deltaproteobacteria bacterium]|jgi:transcriptional regulator with XRE-family HTH domain|nr:helix-turn-helix transcriptional regulator [Deltaproteobacteria bacterium]
MKNRDDDRAFVLAFKAEIKKRGFGAQTDLAEKSGVSKSLINDIINGRTFGKVKTHKALALALGFMDFEGFLAIGRKLEQDERTLARQATSNEALANPEAPTLLEILIENRFLRLELEKTRQELKYFRTLGGQTDKPALPPPAKIDKVEKAERDALVD